MFLGDLACLEDSAPYVARGLLQILQPKDSKFLDAGGLKLFTDRLLIKREIRPNHLSRGPRLNRHGLGIPFQAGFRGTNVSLIDLKQIPVIWPHSRHV